MRIVQILPVLSYGDAIGNEAIAIDTALRDAGYDTNIYARLLHPKYRDGKYKYITEYEDDENTVVIFHLSTGDPITQSVLGLRAHIFVRYHNVTPPDFFLNYDIRYAYNCMRGLKDVLAVASRAEYVLNDSAFNQSDLESMGYQCPMAVVPILLKFSDYAKTPSQKVLSMYKNDGYVNILFTGRIAPNKCQQDIIAAFYCYKNYINPKSRLFIVGNTTVDDPYYAALMHQVERLELCDVIFTGHIAFDEILAYYRLADVFICLSEHEGFCVPLVEAMCFDVPIIAYDCTAVGDTLGGGGLLLKDKDSRIVAEAINRVISDDTLRNEMKQAGQARLKDFDDQKIKKQFLEHIEEFVRRITL